MNSSHINLIKIATCTKTPQNKISINSTLTFTMREILKFITNLEIEKKHIFSQCMQENIRNLKEVHKELGDTFQQGWECPRTLTCHPSTYKYVQTKSKNQMLTNNE
jgi:hypothetical protein